MCLERLINMFALAVPQAPVAQVEQSVNSDLQHAYFSDVFASFSERHLVKNWYVNDEGDLRVARLRRNEFDPTALPTYIPERNEYDELSLEELLEL